MRLVSEPGATKRFRRTPWRFQAMFATPLKSLDTFTRSILTLAGPAESGAVTIDGSVLPPRALLEELSRHGLSAELAHDTVITAENPVETAALLRATFAGWMDFLFTPAPRPFVIYADHDGYATFFANTRGNLQRVIAGLTDHGFVRAENYTRLFS